MNQEALAATDEARSSGATADIASLVRSIPAVQRRAVADSPLLTECEGSDLALAAANSHLGKRAFSLWYSAYLLASLRVRASKW